tara:strand:+ start:192 stop:779 length:588 start_codon:yes stop_codon:yes gene_type:complete
MKDTKNMSDDYKIHGLFPKPVYQVDDLLKDKLNYYETLIKKWSVNLHRNDHHYVDSSHQVDNLHTKKEFINLFDIIILHSKKFLTLLGYDYLDNIKILNSWFNISKQDDYLQKHIHNGSLLSGAFYIKSTINDVINFYDQVDVTQVPDRSNSISYSEYRLECKPGRLLLFKSSLEHGTPRQKSGEKIVVSFNIVL